jgi:HNH endonuclease
MANQPRTLRDFVEARADGCCEYWRRYQDMLGETFFEVEHTVSRPRGGLTARHNLTFACRRCNLLKGDLPKLSIAEPVDSSRCSIHGATAGVITSGVVATNFGYTAALRQAVRQLCYCA